MGNFKKNFFYNIFYQILIIAIPLITTPYISRILGAEGIGIYSYAYSIANYFVIFTMLGINNYGNRRIAMVRDNRESLSDTFSNVYITQLLMGLILTVIYIIYCFKMSDDFIASIILGLYVVSGILDINWFFNGLEQFKLTVIRNTIIKILCTSGIFIFINCKNDVYKYCAIMAFSNLISQIVLWPFVRKNIDYIKPSFAKAKVHFKPNLMLFSTVLAISLFKIMDKIMLGLLTNTTQVGFYESAEKVINIPIAFVAALGAVMLPRITNMIANGKKDDSDIIQSSIFFAMFLSSSICFGIMAVADVFVPMFYGIGFEICIDLFEILLPSCLFLAFANVLRTQYLLPHKLDKVYIESTFLGAGVNICTNLLLIPYFQAKGAAIGTLISEIVVCVFQSYFVNKHMPINKYVLQSCPMFIAGIIMYLVVGNFSLRYSLAVNLIIKIILGCIIYLTILIVFCYKNRKTYIKALLKLKSI